MSQKEMETIIKEDILFLIEEEEYPFEIED
jgi:hypothetical protein